MIPLLRAELRKIFTVRSTYVIFLLDALLVVFVSFYVQGYHQMQDIVVKGYLASQVTGAAQAVGLLTALIGLLLVTHEYRYNSIAYSLTAARSWTQQLLAKFIAVSAVVLVAVLVACLLAPFLTKLGLQLRGLTLIPQHLPLASLLGWSLLYGWGYAMFALIIALIVRNQVGALAALLVVPSVAESLLALALKDNAKYLPFNTLMSVLQQPANYPKAWLVLLLYVVGGAAVAWALFLRRDAN